MNVIELLALAALWGGSFLFMRVAGPEFGPIALMALRVGIATLFLLPVMRTRAARQHFRSRWVALLVVGLTNSAIPFCLFAYSALTVSAGFDAILNATTPLWAAIVALSWLKIRLVPSQLIGLLIGIAGVVVLVWDRLAGDATGVPLAIAAALLAAAFYGFAVNYSKLRLAGVPPFIVAFGSQFFAAVVLIPLSLFFLPKSADLTPGLWLAVLVLGVFCTGVAYLLYFRLIENVGSAFAASVTFLVPVFGVIWGAVFLNEKIAPMMLVGCAIILFGTGLTTGLLKIPRGLPVRK